jgi:TPR repeat protein
MMWWMWLWACAVPVVVPCGEAEAPLCVAQAEALMGAKVEQRVQALGMLEDACHRLGDAVGCRVAGGAWLSGRAAVTLDPDAATGVDSPFGKGIRYLERACALGEGEVCWDLASRTLKGIGLPRDEHKAASWFELACDAGHAEGCVDRGIFYEVGRGGDKDPLLAMEHFTKACEAGDGRGCTKQGLALRAGLSGEGDGAGGVTLMERGCELGFMPGCGIAALAWEKGDGVEADVARRVSMLVAGAALSDHRAVTSLLALHREGAVAAGDLTALSEALKPTCERGDGVACLNLTMVRQASGALDDEGLATAFRIACGRGSDEACGLVHRMLGEGKTASDPGDSKLLLSERGCEAGLADVCLDLGEGYELGTYETVDLGAAARAYERGCRAGDAAACASARRVAAMVVLPSP